MNDINVRILFAVFCLLVLWLLYIFYQRKS